MSKDSKIQERGDLNYFHKNESHEACLAHDDAHNNSKYWDKKINSDKIFKDKTYEVAL